MRRYIWEFDGDVETFFTELLAVIEQKNERYILERKSISRFTLCFKKPYVRSNAWQLFIYGKVEQTPSGITVKAELRMMQLFRVFTALLFSISIFSFFMVNTGFIGYFGATLFFFWNVLLLKIGWGWSNPKGVIALIDGLSYTVISKQDIDKRPRKQ